MMNQSSMVSPGSQSSSSKANAHLAGKYMAFRLADEDYGLAILKVREIIGMMDITKVPCTDYHIRGIINLRGKVIPVIDLRAKFGMEPCQTTDQTVIIVVQYATVRGELTMGVMVDQVQEVLSIDADKIEPAPSFGAGASSADFILGIGKADKRVIFLLDIGRVLSGEEAERIAQAVSA